MIRFENGQPKAIWYSQHANGEAFTYDAVEKDGRRVSTTRVKLLILICSNVVVGYRL